MKTTGRKGRIEREGALSRTLVDSARATLEAGPWRRINVGPSWHAVASLARKMAASRR
jgi:hypothetical protein